MLIFIYIEAYEMDSILSSTPEIPKRSSSKKLLLLRSDIIKNLGYKHLWSSRFGLGINDDCCQDLRGIFPKTRKTLWFKKIVWVLSFNLSQIELFPYAPNLSLTYG